MPRAVEVPAVPLVGVGRGVGGELRRVATLQHHLLVGADVGGLAVGGSESRLATAAGREGGAVLVDVDAVVAGALDGEGAVRRVDLDRLALRETARVDRGVAARQLELLKVGLEGLDTQLGSGAGAQEGGGADLELEVGVVAGVEGVTRGEGSVHLRGGPVLRAGAPERDLAVREAEPWRRGPPPARDSRRGLGYPAGHRHEKRQSRRREPFPPHGRRLPSAPTRVVRAQT